MFKDYPQLRESFMQLLQMRQEAGLRIQYANILYKINASLVYTFVNNAHRGMI